jgi:hypothetical protein
LTSTGQYWCYSGKIRVRLTVFLCTRTWHTCLAWISARFYIEKKTYRMSRSICWFQEACLESVPGHAYRIHDSKLPQSSLVLASHRVPSRSQSRRTLGDKRALLAAELKSPSRRSGNRSPILNDQYTLTSWITMNRYWTHRCRKGNRISCGLHLSIVQHSG